jgi:opacity protein-like surface antigen
LEHYNTIAGQPLGILAVTLDTTEIGTPRAVVEVAGDDADNVFAAQPAAAVLDYGRRLLDDTKFYSGGQSCEVTVVSRYATSYPDACRNNPSWCELDSYDQSDNSWTVTWTYVFGTSTEEADSVQTWNTGS